jgi:hypothetical protein
VEESESDSRTGKGPENIILLVMFSCVYNLSPFDSSKPKETEAVLKYQFLTRYRPKKNIIEVNAIYLFHIYDIQN